MNNNQKRYFAFWIVLFMIFQFIAFVSPGWKAYDKYTESFWIGYLFVNGSFLIQLVCAMSALQEVNLKKLFYRIPLFRISYAGLVVSFIVGGGCMLASPLAGWIAALVSAIVLIINVLAVFKAEAAAELMEEIDDKIDTKTRFIKTLTAEASSLAQTAQTPEAKAACKKVFEALRYSDPMGSHALQDLEQQIALAFSVFSNAVTAGENPTGATEDLLTLIAERNEKCKILK